MSLKLNIKTLNFKEDRPMKKLTPLILISVLFLSACSATYQGSALYDDVYYGAAEVAPVNDVVYERPEYIETDYEYEGDEYTEESNIPDSLRYYDVDETDYEYYLDNPYSARIMRFHGPLWRLQYYDGFYDYAMYDYNLQWGAFNFLDYYYPFMGPSIYAGIPMRNFYDWGWGIGFGWNPYNGFSMGFNFGFGFGYPYYGYGSLYGWGSSYYGYGGWGYPYYSGGYGHYGGYANENVQYGHRNTRGQINSNRTISTPRDARGYVSRTKTTDGSARSTRGSRSVTTNEHRGSSGVVGGLQKQTAKTTPTRTRTSITEPREAGSRGTYSAQKRQTDARSTQRTRTITNGTRTKTTNSSAREQQINTNRQRYTRTTPKYRKPGTYKSLNNRHGTSSRQYTSPQGNTRTNQRYTTRTNTTKQSFRNVTKPATRTQRYSTPSRSLKSVKSSSSKSSGRTYTTKSRSSKSYSSGSRSSSSRSSSGRSGSSSSGSRGKR